MGHARPLVVVHLSYPAISVRELPIEERLELTLFEVRVLVDGERVLHGAKSPSTRSAEGIDGRVEHLQVEADARQCAEPAERGVSADDQGVGERGRGEVFELPELDDHLRRTFDDR